MFLFGAEEHFLNILLGKWEGCWNQPNEEQNHELTKENWGNIRLYFACPLRLLSAVTYSNL